jgi:1-deoxy-D-xylulose-5-phosphate reductoisomerase
MAQRVLVLGSTGSVGTQTLDVLDGLRESHRVVGLSASTSTKLLSEQVARFVPEAVCIADAEAAASATMPDQVAVHRGAPGLVDLVSATRPDIVLCAITGAAGLPSTLAAAESGAIVALANKESMVLAGHLVKDACARSGGRIIPVDSEHSAIAQCLEGQDPGSVRRLILTASGGPFHGRTRDALAEVTPAEALKHPSWEMGPRITIDSATLMNKALEVVEACQLFDVSPDKVDVVVHRQSIIHSMVEFVDGAILAQLSPPDMRLPIRYALGWPGRLSCGAPPVDLTSFGDLTFDTPDRETFPCLALGEQVARDGGLAGCIMNAANEVAVTAFLDGRLPFTGIPCIVEDALNVFENVPSPDLPMILDTDERVRRHAEARILQPVT